MNKILKAKIIEVYGTQADFAAKLRVDDSLVSRVVRCRRILTMRDRKRWADVLNCSAAELFNNQEDRIPPDENVLDQKECENGLANHSRERR